MISFFRNVLREHNVKDQVIHVPNKPHLHALGRLILLDNIVQLRVQNFLTNSTRITKRKKFPGLKASMNYEGTKENLIIGTTCDTFIIEFLSC